MKEYFARNRIKLIHELENRDEHYLDGVQTLTYTVEKNKIKIGWYSRKNIAPIFSNETRKYVINTEYHQVAELEGIPAEGINKIYAFECPTK